MFKGNDLKVKIFYGVCLVLLIVVSFLSYNNFEKNVASNYYLSLTGESENWEVKSYQIKFTPNEFAAGNGTLVTKKKSI